jgi:hypothetical protein
MLEASALGCILNPASSAMLFAAQRSIGYSRLVVREDVRGPPQKGVWKGKARVLGDRHGKG